jgi:hypothetical protein
MKIAYIRKKQNMSPYLIAFIVLTVLFVLLTAIGSRMKQVIRIEVKQDYKQDPSAIFPEVGNFQQFVCWSPWTNKDPSMEITFTGEPLCAGSSYKWKGNRSVGEGKMEITHIEANRRIDMDLEFGRRARSKTGFILEEKGKGTLLTWYFESDLGSSPVNRLVGPMMEKYIRADFEKGLHQLEQHLATL